MDKGWIKANGAFYRMELAKELRALGYELYETKDGFEIKGVSREIIEMFSGRDGQIRAHLWEKYGETRDTASTAHKQEANLATRHGKEKQDGAELRAEWRRRAVDAGLQMPASAKQATAQAASAPSAPSPTEHPREIEKAGQGDRARFRGDLDFDPHAEIAPGVTRIQGEMAARDEERAVGIRHSPEQLERAREEAIQRASARPPPPVPPAAEAGGGGAASGGSLDRVYAEALARGPVEPPSPIAVRAIATEGVQAAVRHLAERESGFERDAILVAAQGFLPAGLVTAHDLEQAMTREYEAGRLLDATAGRYTTAEAIAREHEFIARVREGLGAVPPIAAGTPEAITTADGKILNAGQTNAVKHALESPDRFVAIQGVAGAGKTTAMQAVRERAETAGFQVVGMAPTHKAARELRDAGMENIYTVARATASLPKEIDDKTLVIVDEASMISAADMADLTSKIEASGARAVFLGDTRQLQAVEAGAPFRQMQDHAQTAVLDQIQRQKNPELKACVEAFAAGRSGEGAKRAQAFMREADFSVLKDEYGAPMRFESRTAEHEAHAGVIAQEAAAEFLSQPPEKVSQTLVITGTNSMREAINLNVREGLQERGDLARDDKTIETLQKIDLTREEIRHAGSYKVREVVEFRRDYESRGVSAPVERGRQYEIAGIDRAHNKISLVDRENGRKIEWSPQIAQKAGVSEKKDLVVSTGERVVFRASDADRGIVNGDRGTVIKIEGDQITVTTDRGATLDLRRGDHVQHAYASTVHSAQGATCDHVIVAATSWSPTATAEQGYVGLSRAREGAIVITNSVEGLAEKWAEAKPKEAAMEIRLDDRDHDIDKAAPAPDRAADRAREDENAGWKPRTEPEREHERTHESRSHDLGRSR
jgi:hypothetical protein